MKRPRQDPPVVAPGTPATNCIGSDCYPYTVLKQLGGKGTRLIVVEEEAKVISGPYNIGDLVEYEIHVTDVTNPEELDKAFDQSRIARWRPSRGCFTVGGSPLWLGHRRRYRDPCF